MKYTRTALGLLTRQYRSVLKKCFLINIGLFALALPTQAAQQTATSYDDLLAKLAASSTADVLLDMNGAGITITGDGFTISENQKVALKNIGTEGSSSWTNGSGADYEHRTPSEYFIKNNSGNLSLDNVIVDGAYIRFSEAGVNALIRNYYSGHITQIKDASFTNIYITGASSMGGIIANSTYYDSEHPVDYTATIDLIQNVTAKDILYSPDAAGAPHGGFLENYVNGHIGTIDNLRIENFTMRTDPSMTGGNHGIIDNQAYSIIEKITNSQFINNYLYREGHDIVSKTKNNHVSAAGLYNQGNIGLIQNVRFEGNHVKSEFERADDEGNYSGAGRGAAILSFLGGLGGPVTKDNYVGIGKIKDVWFINNRTENYESASVGAVALGEGGTLNNEWVIGHTSEFTNATFDGNYSHSEGSFSRAGAMKSSGIIDVFTGEFKNNYTKSDASYAQGGALYNVASYSTTIGYSGTRIGSLTANFTNNYADGITDARGGAIYNLAQIGTLTGNFSGNYATAESATNGGAIFNGSTTYNDSTITTINGNFTNNYTKSSIGRANGGALNNNGRGIINSITGDFKNNYAQSDGTSTNEDDKNYARGGAIYNAGTISSIDGDFISNRAQSAGFGSYGGAIYSKHFDENSQGIIGEATGTYQSNHALATNFSGKAQGGAFYNDVNSTVSLTDSEFISNDAISTGFDSTAQGGAIYNLANIAEISGTTFSGNFAKSEQSRKNAISGGAITTLKGEGSFDSYTGIASITDSSFEGNYAQGYAGVYGGAISAGEGLIGTISNTGFTENYATSATSFAYGGALKNSGIINSLGGEFIENYVSAKTYARGGAIYNERDEGDSVSAIFSNTDTANIKALNADLKYNYAQATNNSAFGGAIYNTALMGPVTGDFLGNYASSTNSYAAGGAVYIGHISLTQGTTANLYNSKITSFTGDFAENYAQGTNAIGGAIYNNGTLAIDSISGNFTDNSAIATTEYAYGGAIYNVGDSDNGLTATINNVTGTFAGNRADGQTYARGGAIYNGVSTNLTIKDSTFNGNKALTTSDDENNAQGGAIYNAGLITFKGTNTFKDNLSGWGTQNKADAIYNSGTISLGSNSVLNIYDGVDGSNGVINAAAGSKINIYSDVLKDNTVSLNNAQIQLGYTSNAGNSYGNISLIGLTTTASGGSVYTNNGTTAESYLGAVNLSGDLHYKLDINAGTQATDTLNATDVNNSATRNVIIDIFNELGSTSLASITDENFKIKILYAPNNKIQLALSQDAQSQLGNSRVIKTEYTGTTTDTINATTYWGDTYYSHTHYLDTLGKLGLATTTTTNDSIGMNVTGTDTRIVDGALDNTLILVNADTTNATKYFNANAAAPNYTLGDNLTATKGNMNITGLGAATSTLDLNGHTGFSVSGSGNTLNLKDLTLTSSGSNSTLNSSTTLGLNGVKINNSIAVTNNGTAHLSGTNTINSTIDGSSGTTNVNGGTTTLNAAMTQNNLTIASGAALKTNAGNLVIANAIANSGALQFTGGTLSQAVNGTGSTTAQSGTTTLGAKLTQKDLTINSGATLSANADNLAISDAIADNGTLQLSGGTLSQSVSGTGALNLTGNTTLAAGKTISTNSLNLGTSTLTVNNTANNAINVSAFTNSSASELNLNNNQVQSSFLGAVNLADNLNYKMDINPYAKTADTLTALSVNASSTGNVVIESFNVLGSTAFVDITDENFKIKILNTPSDKLQLALGSTAQSQLGGERLLKEETSGAIPDPIQADNTWGDQYESHTTITYTYGRLGLQTTTTTNDSIGMGNIRQNSITYDSDLGDTLRLVAADTTNENKTFTATTEHPDYVLGGSGAVTVNKNLEVSGLGKTSSTLNLNGNDGFYITGGSSLDIHDLTLINGTGTEYSQRTPTDFFVKNVSGTLSIDNVNIDNAYMYFLPDEPRKNYKAVIRNYDGGHITKIENVSFTNSYIEGTGSMGGFIVNYTDYENHPDEVSTIDSIKNITVKDVLFSPRYGGAPHGGFIENSSTSRIGTIDNIHIENMTMRTNELNGSGTQNTGGNHGIIDNQAGSTIDAITNSQFINNYLYREGQDTVSNTKNNHASAAGLYNQGNIGLIENVRFEGNHTKTEFRRDTDEGKYSGAGGDGAIMSFFGGIGGGVTKDNYVGIGKIKDVWFINNRVENYEPAIGGAVGIGGGKVVDGEWIIGHTSEFTNATFKENYVHSTGGYALAGALDTRGIIDVFTGEFTKNYAQGDGDYAQGGALRTGISYDEIVGYSGARIGSLTADFTGNYTQAKSMSSGGAIVNNAQIGTLSGNFSTNYSVSSDSAAYGGAIYNQTYAKYSEDVVRGYIKSITGDFTENYTSGALNSLGGAINNRGKIDSITGDFIGNHSYSSAFQARGGAIYNDVNSSSSTLISELGSITAKDKGFKENYTYSVAQSAFGGAIFNSQGNIESIDADFTGNYAQSDAATYKASGGALYNNSTIDDITGDFYSNYTLAVDYAAGGAINNNYLGEIGTISGDFSDNYAKSTGTDTGDEAVSVATGGAIFNAGHITKISGDFDQNNAESAGQAARGGAIYQFYGDETSIGIDEISGAFTYNSVKNTNSDGIAYGGAIYNSENMVITVKDSTFIGNYAHNTNTGKDNVKGGAIYNAGNLIFTGTNTFTGSQLEYSNGPYITISMNDIHNTGIVALAADSTVSLNSGLSGENGIINMGSNSRLNLRKSHSSINIGNTINLDNAYLNILRPMSGALNQDIVLDGLTTTANGGTLDIVDDLIQDVNLGAVNLAGNLNYKTDIELNIDAEQSKVDTLTAASINASSTGKIMIDSFNLLGTTTFADITDENYKIQILDVPSDELQLDLSENAQNQLGDERETKVEITDVTPDAIMADTSWEHEYKLHTTYTHTYSKLGLQTTNTTNDSIGMNKTRDEDVIIDTHLGDTLRLVADDATNPYKTFNATADNPNYTVEDGDSELNVRGNLDINGVDKDTSTLDLGDSTFALLDDASLGLNNLTVNNSRDMLVDGQGSVSADAAKLNGNIRTESENNYNVKLTDSTLNGNMQLINRGEGITDVLGLQNSTVNGDIDLTDKHQINIVNANINGDITSHSGKQVISLSGDNDLNGLIIQQSEADDIIVSSNNARLAMLEDTFAESNLQAANTMFNLDNGTLENYKFKQLNDVSPDVSTNLYNIDFDVTDQKSDQITVLDDSAATITINNINIINGSFDDLPQDMTGKEFIVHILNSQNDNAQLTLNETSRRQLPSGDYEIGREVHNCDDVPVANVNWNDKFYHKTQDEVFYGNIGLATTNTKNDSIGLTLTGSYMDKIITHEPLGDTLRLLSNNRELTDKTFTTDNPHSTYKVGEDIGLTYGNLLISGAKNAFNTATIDLDGHKGFDVTKNSAVTIKDVKLVNSGDDTVIRIQKNGKLVLDNTPMNNVNITVDGHLDITNSMVNVKNAAFGSDAILSLKINTLDDYGLFAADSVSFADKAHFKVTLADNLVKIGEEVDIQLLRSSGGSFAAFDDTFDNNLYHFTRKNDDGWYTIRLVKTARQLVAENDGSLTQQDAAGAWVDSLLPNQSEFAAQFREAAQNDVNKFIDNLTSIAPSEAPIVQAMEADNGGLFSMISTHLRNDQYVVNPVRYNAYAPYQQYPQYQRPIYYRQQYRAPQQYQPRYDANGYTYGLSSGDLVNPAQIWLNAYKGKAKFSDGQRQSFDTDRTGIVAALEKRFTRSFKAAAGYSYETGKVDAFKRDVDVDSHKLFAFYEYKPNNFFINGAVACAMSSYKEDKKVFDKSVNASYDTTTISAQTLFGYETRYFIPEMGVRAYFIDRDGYTDSAEQKVTSHNMNIVRGVAGVRAGVDIDMGSFRKLRPELYVGVNYDFVGDKDKAVITLPNGETYSMDGQSLGKFGIETGAGISADFTQRFSLSARYAGDYRDKYKSHTGIIGMKYKF